MKLGEDVSQNWSVPAELIPNDDVKGVGVSKLDAHRVLDIIGLTLAVIILAPLMLAIGLAIWLSDGGPVFFGHTRVGKMGRTFRCWKFRSMVMNSDQVLRDYLIENSDALAEWETNHKLRNDPRITPIGHLLRRSSLDELPQLWNVFRGEMSLVGPRPIVAAEIARYQDFFEDYCSCLPGITGLWQISGRNDVTYQQRVDLDVKFARSRSVWLYLRIIASTIPAVLARRGAY